MKSIKSLVGTLMLALVIFSCEKATETAEIQQQKPSFVMDDLTNAFWRGDCDKPYEITLFQATDLGNGMYEWKWGISNPTGGPALTKISFPIPKCVKFSNPKFALTDQAPQAARVYRDDESYENCLRNTDIADNLLTFVIPTRGTETTFFYLTLSTKEFELGTGYFKDASGKCGSTCFPGIKDECIIVSCSFSQGRYFASPHKWPAPGTVTLGGHTYTEAEGRAIWRSTNRGGISDAKKAFHQAAAIKLSASTISSSASVWADVKIIEDWLKTLPKLTPTNHYNYSNKAAADAAGRIGNWIDRNHCRG